MWTVIVLMGFAVFFIAIYDALGGHPVLQKNISLVLGYTRSNTFCRLYNVFKYNY